VVARRRVARGAGDRFGLAAALPCARAAARDRDRHARGAGRRVPDRPACRARPAFARDGLDVVGARGGAASAGGPAGDRRRTRSRERARDEGRARRPLSRGGRGAAGGFRRGSRSCGHRSLRPGFARARLLPGDLRGPPRRGGRLADRRAALLVVRAGKLLCAVLAAAGSGRGRERPRGDRRVPAPRAAARRRGAGARDRCRARDGARDAPRGLHEPLRALRLDRRGRLHGGAERGVRAQRRVADRGAARGGIADPRGERARPGG